MKPFGLDQQAAVSKCGASAGQVLCGCGLSNRGLRLRVSEEQPRGAGGPIRGAFVILDAGDNKHSAALLPLLGLDTDAAEVTALIRLRYPGCVSVANANILAPEPP